MFGSEIDSSHKWDGFKVDAPGSPRSYEGSGLETASTFYLGR